MWSSRFDPATIAARLALAAGGGEGWADGARREHATAGAGSHHRPAAVLLPLLRLRGDIGREGEAEAGADHPAAAPTPISPPSPPPPISTLATTSSLSTESSASPWHLLFIRRAEHPHDRHSGEVAFPGGRVDPLDPDLVATALREAEEEIGLAPDQVEVLGQLPAFHTVSGYRVTPVVGLIPWPLALRPDPTEVAEVFTLPLDWLREPGHRHTRLWPHPGHPQAREVIFYQEREGRRLWGVTAWITVDFLGCLEPWDRHPAGSGTWHRRN